MRWRIKSILAGAVALALASKSDGQVIGAYNFGTGGAGSFTYGATTVAPNTTASALNSTNPNGTNNFGSTDTFAMDIGVGGTSGWYTNNSTGNYLTISSTGSTTDNGFWLQATFTAAPGYVLDPTGFKLLGGAGSSSNVRSAYIFDNVDGFPTNINTSAGSPAFTGGFQLAGGSFTAVRGTSGPPAMNLIQASFPVTDINLSSLTIRTYFDTQGQVSKNIDLGLLELDGSVVTPPTVTAATWNASGSGDYNNSANWTSGVPMGVDAHATLGAAITANNVVYTNQSITLGTLTFNNSSASYSLSGNVGSSLNLQTSTGSALVDVQSGTHQIDIPMNLLNNTTFQTDSAGSKLVIANPLNISSGATLTTTGSGTVTYLSTITLGGAAAMSIVSSAHPAALILGSGSTVTVSNTSAGSTLLQVDTLTDTGGNINIGRNALMVNGGMTLSQVTGQVASAYQNGAWNGSGISSSIAAADTTHLTTVGVIPAQTGQTFDGAPETTGGVLVKYTYYGDATLDGHVDGSDYSRIDNGYLSKLTGWNNGDFNYDNVVDGSDYTLIDNAFNSQGAAISSEIATPTGEIAGAVPEPATLGLLGFGAVSLLGRRRRNV